MENYRIKKETYTNRDVTKYYPLVKAVDANKGCLIGNNKGGINGWTKNVYGKVVEVLK